MNMLRIGKMTDYGIVLLITFVHNSNKKGALTARDLSEASQLPLPTVSKLLKTLCRAQILTSQRGVSGGYRLSRPAGEISVASVIEVLEGPIAITQCSTPGGSSCNRETFCPVRFNWKAVTQSIRGALEGLTLAEVARNAESRSFSVQAFA